MARMSAQNLIYNKLVGQDINWFIISISISVVLIYCYYHYYQISIVDIFIITTILIHFMLSHFIFYLLFFCLRMWCVCDLTLPPFSFLFFLLVLKSTLLNVNDQHIFITTTIVIHFMLSHFIFYLLFFSLRMWRVCDLTLPPFSFLFFNLF